MSTKTQKFHLKCVASCTASKCTRSSLTLKPCDRPSALQNLKDDMCASEEPDQPAHLIWVVKDAVLLHTNSEEWSFRPQRQSDLSNRWALCHFVGCWALAHLTQPELIKTDKMTFSSSKHSSAMSSESSLGNVLWLTKDTKYWRLSDLADAQGYQSCLGAQVIVLPAQMIYQSGKSKS